MTHLPNAIVTADTRINPVAPQNRVETIEKLHSGALRVTQRSGNTFDIAAEDELFQVFAVYTMISDVCS